MLGTGVHLGNVHLHADRLHGSSADLSRRGRGAARKKNVDREVSPRGEGPGRRRRALPQPSSHDLPEYAAKETFNARLPALREAGLLP